MTVPAHRLLAAVKDRALENDLKAALEQRGIEVVSVGTTDAIAPLSQGDQLIQGFVVAPTLSAVTTGDVWKALAEELTDAFGLIQAYVRNAAARAKGGHIVALLPAAAAMGDPLDRGSSGLAGGILSLFRTLALELKKLDMTANSVLYECADGRLVGSTDLASVITTLVGQHDGAITGQEIFAFAGQDAGRLRP